MRAKVSCRQEDHMRRISLSFLYLALCGLAIISLSNATVLGRSQVSSPVVRPSTVHGAQGGGIPTRNPDTEAGQPGTWAQPAKGKRTVNVTQLKSEARELTSMSQLLPDQMEQIGNGKLPKDLIENLKKIEKLAKHIRSEVE
jgi:hypothetical protein